MHLECLEKHFQQRFWKTAETINAWCSYHQFS